MWDTTATSWSGCSTAQPTTGDGVLQPCIGCDALVLTLLCLATEFHNLAALPQAPPTPLCGTVPQAGHWHTLQRRGPDSLSTEKVSTFRITLSAVHPARTSKLLIPPTACHVPQVDLGAYATLELQGSLLQLRGTIPSVSPLKDENENLLVLNGTSQCSSWRQQQSALVCHVKFLLSPFSPCLMRCCTMLLCLLNQPQSPPAQECMMLPQCTCGTDSHSSRSCPVQERCLGVCAWHQVPMIVKHYCRH